MNEREGEMGTQRNLERVATLYIYMCIYMENMCIAHYIVP